MKKLDKKGAISIIYVISIFISTIIAMGFVSIGNKTIAINEMQGIMDVSGVIALRKSVDEVDWRLEKLTVDKSQAKAEFINLVNKEAGYYVGENKLLKKFEVRDVNVVKGEDTTFGNITNKSDREYYLEATAVATYGTYSFTDRVSFHAITFFDFLKTGESSSVAVGGTTEDGNVEVIIRTVSRLSLR